MSTKRSSRPMRAGGGATTMAKEPTAASRALNLVLALVLAIGLLPLPAYAGELAIGSMAKGAGGHGAVLYGPWYGNSESLNAGLAADDASVTLKAAIYEDGCLAIECAGGAETTGMPAPTSGSEYGSLLPWSAANGRSVTEEMSAIKSIEFGAGVAPSSLQRYFCRCANLESIPSLPDGVEDLSFTFWNCTSLAESPAIPSSVTTMQQCFQNCTSLVSAPAIPEGVTNLQNAFYGCTSLAEAPLIPSGVTTAGAAFYGCNALAQLPAGFSLPNDAPADMFAATGSYSAETPLETYCDAADYDALAAAYDWSAAKRVLVARGGEPTECSVTITLSDNMSATGGDLSQTGLTGAMTDVTVTPAEGYLLNAPTIDPADAGISASGDQATGWTVSGMPTADVAVTFAAAFADPYAAHDGVKYGPWEVGSPTASTVTAAICNDGTLVVTGTGDVIAANSLETWSTLPWGHVPNTMYDDINPIALEITAVEWGEGVAPTSLGFWFRGCSNLTSVTIPESVTGLRSTFWGCAALTEIPAFSDDVTELSGAFAGTGITKAPAIPAGVTDLGSAFEDCASLTEAPVIPEGVTSLYRTFENCTSLVKAPAIPESVTGMYGTFWGCTSLAEAPLIPVGVEIFNNTFFRCPSLTQLPAGFEFPPDTQTSGVFWVGSPYTADNLLVTYCDPADYEALSAYDWAADHRELRAAEEPAEFALACGASPMYVANQPAQFTVTAEGLAAGETVVEWKWQITSNPAAETPKWTASTAAQTAEGDACSITVAKPYSAHLAKAWRCTATTSEGRTATSEPMMFAQAPAELAVVSGVAPEFALGSTADFTVTVEGLMAGESVASYQWYYSKDGGATFYKTSFVGAATDTLTTSCKPGYDTRVYRCKIATSAGRSATGEAQGYAA